MQTVGSSHSESGDILVVAYLYPLLLALVPQHREQTSTVYYGNKITESL